MKAKKKELGNLTKTEAKTKIQTAVWSPWQEWRIRRSSGCEAKNNPRVQWGVGSHAHFLELFQHTLCYSLHTLLHMAHHPKAHTTPTNSNVHVLPVGSKNIEMCTRHKICTFSIGTIWLVIFARDLFSRFRKSRAIHKIKTAKILSSMCKANKPSFNLRPTWIYLSSCQQMRASECAFDSHRWSYPRNWSAT